MCFLFTLFSIFVLGMCTHSLPLTESQILWYFFPVHGWHTPEFVWHSLLSADGPICVIDFSGVKRDDWHRMSHVVAQSSVLPINTSHKQQPKVSHFRLYYVWFLWLCLYLPSRFYTVTISCCRPGSSSISCSRPNGFEHRLSWLREEPWKYQYFPEYRVSQKYMYTFQHPILTLRLLMSYIYIYIYIWSAYSWCF